jgi:uncharacterized protein (DUF427 family)
MRAEVDGRVIAESEDVVECDGYRYFPKSAVRMECLRASPRTADDRQCPHGVQFYDVVVGGKTHARNAWSYEAPRESMQQVAQRVGFWDAVRVS